MDEHHMKVDEFHTKNVTNAKGDYHLPSFDQYLTVHERSRSRIRYGIFLESFTISKTFIEYFFMSNHFTVLPYI